MVANHESHYVGGEYRAAHSAETISVVNPSTEEVFASIVDGDSSDIDAAVQVADAAGVTWAATPPSERAASLRRLADTYEAVSMRSLRW